VAIGIDPFRFAQKIEFYCRKFRHAFLSTCRAALHAKRSELRREGIISNTSARLIGRGRSPNRIKVKNTNAPAIKRVRPRRIGDAYYPSIKLVTGLPHCADAPECSAQHHLLEIKTAVL
jgi:hypothetical protein